MGAIADAFAAYAQPLLELTDGTEEDLNRALAMSQICYNLALSPEGEREKMISDMQATFHMGDKQFDEFRTSIVDFMVRRHEEMFPFLHQRSSDEPWPFGPTVAREPAPAPAAKKYPGTDRYAPCPCNSGKKYKFCCGATRR